MFGIAVFPWVVLIEKHLTKMQVFALGWKTCFISVENLVMFYLVFHKVSRFIHLTQNNSRHLLALDCMNN